MRCKPIVPSINVAALNNPEEDKDKNEENVAGCEEE